MKKIFTLLSFILIVVSASNAQSGFYVDPIAGDDGSGSGTFGSPWKTLSHAVSSAAPANGDSIYIGPGTITADGAYGYGITLDKKIRYKYIR